jgi:hypothetical protein
MKRCWPILAILLPLALGLLIGACYSNSNEHKASLTEYTGSVEAKDRPPGTSCDQENIVIQDCLDACSCCFQNQDVGQNSSEGACVQFCDTLLEKEMAGNINPVYADLHGYGECILGCVSLCGANVTDQTVCWEQCKSYLDLVN